MSLEEIRYLIFIKQHTPDSEWF